MQSVSAIEAFVAQISNGLAVLLGLNYYALVWAFFGALIPLTKVRRIEGLRVVVYVLFSALLGAILSTGAADFFKITTRSVISVMAVIAGASWQTMVALLVLIAEGQLEKFIPPRKPPGGSP